MTLDELFGFRKKRMLYLELTEEEQDAILAMIEECEQESEMNSLHKKLYLLKQYVRAFFSRAQSK
jgi:hypothetical protein